MDNIKSGSVKDLVALLTEHGILWNEWENGATQSLNHLLQEIEKGESVLSINEQGRLIRTVKIVYIDIFHTTSAGQLLKLEELRQVFKDGRERRRTLPGSIAEKLGLHEKADESAVRRAIKEELGISTDLSIFYKGSEAVTEDSPSYPGLLMFAENRFFDSFLDATQFKSEGYVEQQEDKDTYFVWKPHACDSRAVDCRPAILP